LARELTKLHEEVLRGTAASVREQLQGVTPRGEMTLLIGRQQEPAPDDRPLAEAVEEAIRSGMERMEAIKQVARLRGLSKREVYQSVSGPDSKS
jgi:16S rRNA (cytidine1402-2'-O)-methyltransferase